MQLDMINLLRGVACYGMCVAVMLFTDELQFKTKRTLHLPSLPLSGKHSPKLFNL